MRRAHRNSGGSHRRAIRMTNLKTLYDADFVAWTEQQAAALRVAAQGSTNQGSTNQGRANQGGTNQALDWENLAEEIESLGRSDRRELRSQIYRIVRHLAKLQFSSATDPRHGWRESIIDGRVQVELLVEDSPSLKPQLDQIVAEQTPRAIDRALADLGGYGEIDRATEQALRAARYSVDQVLGDWFPPDPTAGPDSGA